MGPETNKLGAQPVRSLLLSLALPAICAQIVTLLYNLVDRIYIGRMENGALVMAAVGICAPIVTAVDATTALFGRGGAPLASIRMGEGDTRRAERYLGSSVGMLLLSALVLTFGVLSFQTPLLTLFGATDATLGYAMDYLSIYILGTVFVQMTVGMNYYITAQGFAKTAMLTTMLGGVLNIILDPILIFALKLGIRGAALATVFSQFVSFVWVMRFLLGKRSTLKIRKENLLPDPKILREMLVLGSAPFFMNLSEGLLNICFNRQVLRFGGDAAVGAMTVLFSVFNFILMPVEGVAQGAQPIISFNYGAKQFRRVREAIRLSILWTTAFTVLATTLILLFPETVVRVFNRGPALVEAGAPMLRIYVGGLFILGANSSFQQTYNAMGEGGKAFFFAFYRKIILLIPLIFLLPHLLPWGVPAVILAEPISDTLTTVTNAVHFRSFLRKKLPVSGT